MHLRVQGRLDGDQPFTGVSGVHDHADRHLMLAVIRRIPSLGDAAGANPRPERLQVRRHLRL